MQLRQGPSGPPIVGRMIGDVLTWDGHEWQPEQPGSAYASQREWYIDAAGDDSGQGTIDDPLRTGAELSRRISPLLLPDDTTVYYLSDMLSDDYLLGPAALAPGKYFNVEALNLTLEASVTITAFQAGDAATLARNRVTVAGQPNWWAGLEGHYWKKQGTEVGGWLDKGDPADNTSAFISYPILETNSTFPALSAGDVLEFRPRRLIGSNLSISPRLLSSFSGSRMRDLRLADNSVGEGALWLSNVSQAWGCEFAVFSLSTYYYQYFYNCSLGYPLGSSYIDLGQHALIFGGFNRGRQFWGGPGTVELQSFTTSDTRVELHQQLEFDVSRVTAFWDFPTGPALEAEPACFVNHRARMYGSSTAANTYGFSFNTGSFGHISNGQNAANRPNIRGTLGTGGSGVLTRDLNIGGTNVFYAVGATVLPYLNPTNACGFVTRVAT